MNARTNKTAHGTNYGKTYNRRNWNDGSVVLHEKALEDRYVFEGSERDIAITTLRQHADAKNRVKTAYALKRIAVALERNGAANPVGRAKWLLRTMEAADLVSIH
jgi:hypothetical protein